MNTIVGVQHGAYSFVASTRVITVTGLPLFQLEQVLTIVNATRNAVAYSFDSATPATAAVAGTAGNQTITLSAVPGGSANADKLQIILAIPEQNVILDTGNSVTGFSVATGTPYVGTARDLLANGGWQGITYNIIQTTAGVAGTLFFEFGPDGTNWPVSITTDLTGQPFILPLPLATVRRWFRMRCTTAGTTFTIDLETLLHRTCPADLTQLPSQNMSATTPLKNVRSLLHMEKFKAGISQGFGNVPGNENGNQIIADFLTEVQKSNVAGHSLTSRYGFNPAVGTTAETVNDASSGIYAFPAAAAVVSLVSSSALDTNSAGTGARTVTVNGLDSSYNPVTVTVNLTGIVAALTTQTFLRVFDITVATAGSGGVNAGTITATISAGSVAVISPGNNRSQSGIYTIPAGKTGYLLQAAFAGQLNSAGAVAQGQLFIRDFGALFELEDTYLTGATSPGVTVRYIDPIKIPEKSDIRVDASASNAGTTCTTRYDILLVNN